MDCALDTAKLKVRIYDNYYIDDNDVPHTNVLSPLQPTLV